MIPIRTIIITVCTLLLATSAPLNNAHAQSAGSILNSVSNALNGNINSQAAVGFSRDGVYGCNGATFGVVGQQGPGGSFVPVFSDAEHDQVRLLTYKECLLDGIVNSMRETLVSFITRSIVDWSNQGFSGNPAYVENLPLHLLERISDPEAERIILGGETDAITASHRRNIRVALAKYYANKTRRPSAHLTCGATSNQLSAFGQNDSGALGGWDGFFAVISDPSCNPLFSYYEARNRLDEAVSAENERERTQLDWAGGFRTSVRSEEIDLGDGTSQQVDRIVTPGILISQHIEQVIGTGLRQSENADEIDEIVSALMSNLGTQTLTDLQGLYGLSQSFNGRPPYLDQLSGNSAQSTRDAFLNAGLSTVRNATQNEQSYRTARLTGAQTLLNAEGQLRTWERACWDALVARAKQDLAADAETEACDNANTNNTTNNTTDENDTGETTTPPCSITASVSEILEQGSIGARVTNTTVTPYGRTVDGGSALSVVITSNGVTAGPERPSVQTNGLWESAPINVEELPAGTLTITATETATTGNVRTVRTTVTKEVSALGTFVRPPLDEPSVVITATTSGGGVTESATLTPTIRRTRNIQVNDMRPLVTVLADQVERSELALQVLDQIIEAAQNTNSSSAQRFILERVDQLVANRVLHTDAQVRQANDQAQEIRNAMEQLLDSTRESWEGGWCQPDNWRQLAS